MFDRARGAKTAALDTVTVPAAKLAAGAETPAAAAAAPSAAAAAADSKSASFAAMVQAQVDAAPRAGERSELPAAHELAPLGAQSALSAPVQQASLAVAQATGTPTDRLAARVGTPAWDNQVGQKIIWMAAGQEQSATLTLNPPDMGPMQVVLSVTNDQAQVTFSAAQPEVRAALEQAMPKLREMMSESGIALGNATVNDGAADQRQAQQGEQSRGRGAVGGGSERAGSQAGTVEVPVRRGGRLLGGNGAVDTFA
jgi:flagellar hook-length control protein FliK